MAKRAKIIVYLSCICGAFV